MADNEIWVKEGLQAPDDTEASMVIEVERDDKAHPSHPINLHVSFLDDDVENELSDAPAKDLWLSKTGAKKLAAILNRLAKEA